MPLFCTLLRGKAIAENFDKLYSVYILLVEGGDNLVGLNKQLFDLPQSYIDKMKELKWEHQGIFASIKNRFGCILNPNYEIFHYERMKPEEERLFDNAGDYGGEDLGDRIGASDDARAFLDTLDNFCMYNKGSFVDRINHEIRKLNLPEEMLLPPETDAKGVRKASPLLKVFLPGNGVQIPTADLVKGFDMVCFTNPATGQTHFLKYDGFNYKSVDMSRLPEPLRSGADKLMKALEEADPWYIRIFTGSKEFNEMKRAAKAVQELKDEMGLSPTKEQREEMTKRLSTLTEKAGYYLQSKADGIQMDSSDAERARITAAERLLDCSLEGRALLGGYEQTLAFKANVHDAAEAANNEGMKKQAKEEKAFLRAREFTKPAREALKAEATLTMGDLWTENMTDQQKARVKDEQEVSDFYRKGFLKNDPLAKLAESIYQKRNLDAENADVRAVRIAEMVTLDIILRERMVVEEGTTGAIESLFRSAPSSFVEGLTNSRTIRNLASNIEATQLRDMVKATARDNIQQLTTQILKEQGIELPETPQPQLQQQIMQGQVQISNVPEHPKSGPSMV